MSKRWESARSESVQLIPQKFNLLSLLFDNIHKFPLVRDLLDLLGRISDTISARLTLEPHDLLPLVHVLLELSSLGFELLVLSELVLYLFPELFLGFRDGFDSLLGVFVQLADLVI